MRSLDTQTRAYLVIIVVFVLLGALAGWMQDQRQEDHLQEVPQNSYSR